MVAGTEANSGYRLPFWTRAWLFAICIGLAIGGFWLYVLSTAIYEGYRDIEIERIYSDSDAAVRAVKYEVEQVLAQHPEARSLRELESTLSRFCTKQRGRDIDLLSIRLVGPDNRILVASPPDMKGQIDPCAEAAGVTEGREWHFTHDEENPGPVCVAVPIMLQGRVKGGLVIHTSMALVNKKTGAVRREMFLGVFGAVSLLYLVWGFLLHREWQRERAIEKLRENAERMTALGDLAAGVAHEIRNPLNTIALTIQYLERLHSRSAASHPEEEIPQNFRLVHNELDRLSDIIENFITFAKPRPLNPERAAVGPLLEETLQLFEPELKAAQIVVEREIPEEAEAFLDTESIRQCFINVIKNAVDAMADGGTLRVRVRRSRGDIRVTFSDTGKGIRPEDIDRLFDPYFSTKKSGLGVGLAITKRILMAHQGDIYAESEPRKGATFTLILPAKEPVT